MQQFENQHITFTVGPSVDEAMDMSLDDIIGQKGKKAPRQAKPGPKNPLSGTQRKKALTTSVKKKSAFERKQKVDKMRGIEKTSGEEKPKIQRTTAAFAPKEKSWIQQQKLRQREQKKKLQQYKQTKNFKDVKTKAPETNLKITVPNPKPQSGQRPERKLNQAPVRAPIKKIVKTTAPSNARKVTVENRAKQQRVVTEKREISVSTLNQRFSNASNGQGRGQSRRGRGRGRGSTNPLMRY